MNTPKPESKYRLSPDRANLIRTAPPAILNLLEASALLCCSARKLRYLVAGGQIKHRRIGNRIVIKKTWIDEFLGA